MIYDPYYIDHSYVIDFNKDAFKTLKAKDILYIFKAHITKN
jgi:hypothetical protein